MIFHIASAKNQKIKANLYLMNKVKNTDSKKKELEQFEDLHWRRMTQKLKISLPQEELFSTQMSNDEDEEFLRSEPCLIKRLGNDGKDSQTARKHYFLFHQHF